MPQFKRHLRPSAAAWTSVQKEKSCLPHTSLPLIFSFDVQNSRTQQFRHALIVFLRRRYFLVNHGQHHEEQSNRGFPNAETK